MAQRQARIGTALLNPQARLHEAEADTSAIPFSGDAAISSLRAAAGKLEGASGRAVPPTKPA